MPTDPPSALGVITIDIDPVLHLGPFSVHWYGVMYAVAFLAAFRFGVLPYARRKGLPRAIAEKMTVWTIVFGLIGGRLYYVVQQPDLVQHYLEQPLNIIAIWQGGMAFFGAIISGFITLAITAWRYGYNPWLAADGGVIFAVVGQPIGRIGNIINGDILGARSTLPWATAYTHVSDASTFPQHCAVLQSGFSCGVAYQPAGAYEALATIVIGIVLYALLRRRPRDGVLALVYIALYAISQLIVFQFRASEPPGPLGLREAQWTSIVMLGIVLPLGYLLWRATSKRLEARGVDTAQNAQEPTPATT